MLDQIVNIYLGDQCGSNMNPSTNFHAFNIWHMAKSLLKKLTAAAKTHPKIGLWTRSLVNHFWLRATGFSNDMKKCCKFVHTGKLESFRNLKLMYLPKSTGFTMLTCIIMTMLAAIQNQVYIEQNNSGKVHHVAQWSRASKKHVVKERTEYDSVFFKKIIIGEVNSNLTSNAVLDMDLTPYMRQPVPKTFHGETAPSMDDLLATRLTRMS